MIRDFHALSDVGDKQFSATSHWKLDKIHPKLDGHGITIAILDSGINRKHKAFTERFDQRQVNGKNFVDPVHTAYTAWETSEIHGSMVAFIAGGKSFEAKIFGSGKSVSQQSQMIPSGVAPGASLLICRVSEPFTSAAVADALDTLFQTNEKLTEKIQDEKELGPTEVQLKKPTLAVDIICMSFGMNYEQNNENHKKIRDRIRDLSRQGVICVAAAGNYGGDQSDALFPANMDNVISVGALNKDRTVKDSNPHVSDSVDVYAPGENVPAPLVDTENGVQYFSGSSCAAPAVAGLLALLLQFDRDKHKLLKCIPGVDKILKRNHRDLIELKSKVFKKDMKRGDPSYILHPYEYFTDNCRVPLTS